MAITILFLVLISVVVFPIFYITEKIILQREVSLKRIFKSIFLSVLISFISAGTGFILFKVLKIYSYVYVIPLSSIVIYVIVLFFVYTKRLKKDNQ